MKLVFNSINKDIFLMLQDGRKKIETRAATIKYKKLKIGDDIIFSCGGESFDRKIKKITYLDSIKSLLEIYNPEDINPAIKEKDELVAMYHSFPGYEEKIKNNGIVALEFMS